LTKSLIARAIDPLRQTALESQALERRDDVLTCQTLAHRDLQAFAGVDVQDGQGTKAPPVGEFIGDEIHAPDVVAGRGRSPLFSVHRRGVSPRAFAP